MLTIAISLLVWGTYSGGKLIWALLISEHCQFFVVRSPKRAGKSPRNLRRACQELWGACGIGAWTITFDIRQLACAYGHKSYVFLR